MADKPDAFLSYTRFDDRRQKVSDFREWLSDAVEEVSGHPFDIFQDIEGIGLGEKWQDVLDHMLDQARFFIPILTPKFFNSRPCRDELTKFLDLERKTGREDLVLPIYWITCPVLEEGHLKAKDELAQVIDERQRWDWRELRYEAFETKEVQRDLAGLASQIERARRNVLRVVETPKAAVGNGQTKSRKKPSPKLKTVAAQVPEPEPSSAPAIEPFQIIRDIDAPWCPEMILIPKGTFLMGSPENEAERRSDEVQHEVTISKPFLLGRYAVTFEEYDHFCEATGRDKPGASGWGRGKRPAINISWDDAAAYCAWLSEATGRHYHLPSEAQWEYACRAGTETPFSYGASITTDQVNFDGNYPYAGTAKGEYRKKTVPVGSLPANPWGLHEMHGNVWEWCADWLGDFSTKAVTDPQGAAPWHVPRGARWFLDRCSRGLVRSACRLRNEPDFRLNNFLASVVPEFRRSRELSRQRSNGTELGGGRSRRPGRARLRSGLISITVVLPSMKSRELVRWLERG